VTDNLLFTKPPRNQPTIAGQLVTQPKGQTARENRITIASMSATQIAAAVVHQFDSRCVGEALLPCAPPCAPPSPIALRVQRQTR
jgi:hypothetical protein